MTRDEERGVRVRELLADRALEGLDAQQAAELEQLDGGDDQSFDLAAAAVALAALPVESMPPALSAKILRDAEARARPRPTPRLRTVVMGICLAAAALLLVLMGAWWGRATAPRPEGPELAREPTPRAAPTPPSVPAPLLPPSPAPAPSPAPDPSSLAVAPRPTVPSAPPTVRGAQLPAGKGPRSAASQARAKLLAEARDVRRLRWTRTADPAGLRARGDVVWSRARQEGYMRFVGLAPNDRRRFQYQLWIFDKRRDQRFPVDGGVFDVNSRGELIVPITARLRVSRAALFAVTVERPGGVVVSDRKRIVVTAAPAAG